MFAFPCAGGGTGPQEADFPRACGEPSGRPTKPRAPRPCAILLTPCRVDRAWLFVLPTHVHFLGAEHRAVNKQRAEPPSLQGSRCHKDLVSGSWHPFEL